MECDWAGKKSVNNRKYKVKQHDGPGSKYSFRERSGAREMD